MDHMRRRTIRLSQVGMVVLDEADEMLNMGFIEDIETILKDIPEERQTLLFSATMPAPIQTLAGKFMRSPEVIRSESRQVTVPNIKQSYIVVEEKQKFDVLCRLLDTQLPDRTIVFGRTKRRVDEVFEALSKRGYSADGLHGDMSQSRRDLVMRQFKEGTVEVLVATDVAARGLDITGVTHIYNFDIPQDPEGYVHRIGRTGRAGKTGVAITFVTPREIHHLKIIENMTGGRIARKPVPSITEAFEEQQRLAVDKLLLAVEKEDLEKYKGLAESLLEETDAVTLLSAALKVLTKEPDRTSITLTGEKTLGTKKKKSDSAGQRGYNRIGSSKK
jgi:ATP-dependent RNA helicase DeaD